MEVFEIWLTYGKISALDGGGSRGGGTAISHATRSNENPTRSGRRLNPDFRGERRLTDGAMTLNASDIILLSLQSYNKMTSVPPVRHNTHASRH